MPTTEEPILCDRQISIFALIAERLEHLKLSHWTSVIFTWLARYDGLTRCYFEDEEEAPAHEVLRAVNSLRQGASDAEVASLLASLDFLTWRIKHPDTGDRWDPTAGSLHEFIGMDRHPICWKWDGVYPSKDAIEAWLLEQLHSQS
jgi:hypothetical protein